MRISSFHEKKGDNTRKNRFSRSSHFNKYQSGRSNHSCETALQVTLSKWKIDVDANKYVYSGSFSISGEPLRSLLMKLQCCRLTGIAYSWFESYLQNRSQCTKEKHSFNQSSTGCSTRKSIGSSVVHFICE